jgi:hypothetical protein
MSEWTRLTLEPIQRRERATFVRDAVALFDPTSASAVALDDGLETDEAVAAVQSLTGRVTDANDRSWADAIVAVIADLVQQGWTLQFRQQHLWAQRPLTSMPREIIRQRLLVRRDEQLTKPPVRDFVQKMERWRLFRGNRTSIVSLMRDGRALAKDLGSGASLADLIDPYLQFVTPEEICDQTGLRTQDIWRYFRHTWSNPYESVPGRSLQLLVRDRAVPFHPVIGIAALSSAAVRLGPRDRFIGWDTGDVVEDLLAADRCMALSWTQGVLHNALDEIYLVDLIRDDLLPADPARWTLETASACAQASLIAREQHHRLMEAKEYKFSDDVSTEEACVARAEMYLFRAKRTNELAKLIPMLLQLRNGIPEGTEGRDLLAKIVRIARSKTVGTEIADLTVCGAVAPYSHLAAGKLVAMLAITPEVICEYKRRYEGVPGIIASSMAGKPVRRLSNLCYVGTTSLYGRRPNQYDRLAMPASLVGGNPMESIRYEHIHDKVDSRTQGIGTFHFSSKTLKGLERFVSTQKGGWKVNNVFGEGTSPKLRGLRDGLVALGLNAEELLVHGIERCLYGVKLASNLERYLLGMDESPNWVFDPAHPSTRKVSDWWVKRWAGPRARRDDIIASVARDGLAYPIRHGARVQLPERDDPQAVMF